MFSEGTIKAYNEDKGFGFIQVEEQRKDLFFHISALPHRQYAPKIGEKLKFSIVHDNNGRMRAENIVRLDIKIEENKDLTSKKTSSNLRKNYRNQSTKSSFNFISLLIGFLIVSIFLIIFVPFISGIYKRETLKTQVVEPNVKVSTIHDSSTASQYSCDGRTYCNQMTSHEEALFFINNCPGTKMDGDGDGDPCEDQFR